MIQKTSFLFTTCIQLECLYKLNTRKKITMRVFHIQIINDIIDKYSNINDNVNDHKKSTIDYSFKLYKKQFRFI